MRYRLGISILLIVLSALSIMVVHTEPNDETSNSSNKLQIEESVDKQINVNLPKPSKLGKLLPKNLENKQSPTIPNPTVVAKQDVSSKQALNSLRDNNERHKPSHLPQSPPMFKQRADRNKHRPYNVIDKSEDFEPYAGGDHPIYQPPVLSSHYENDEDLNSLVKHDTGEPIDSSEEKEQDEADDNKLSDENTVNEETVNEKDDIQENRQVEEGQLPSMNIAASILDQTTDSSTNDNLTMSTVPTSELKSNNESFMHKEVVLKHPSKQNNQEIVEDSNINATIVSKNPTVDGVDISATNTVESNLNKSSKIITNERVTQDKSEDDTEETIDAEQINASQNEPVISDLKLFKVDGLNLSRLDSTNESNPNQQVIADTESKVAIDSSGSVPVEIENTTVSQDAQGIQITNLQQKNSNRPEIDKVDDLDSSRIILSQTQNLSKTVHSEANITMTETSKEDIVHEPKEVIPEEASKPEQPTAASNVGSKHIYLSRDLFKQSSEMENNLDKSACESPSKYTSAPKTLSDIESESEVETGINLFIELDSWKMFLYTLFCIFSVISLKLLSLIPNRSTYIKIDDRKCQDDINEPDIVSKRKKLEVYKSKLPAGSSLQEYLNQMAIINSKLSKRLEQQNRIFPVKQALESLKTELGLDVDIRIKTLIEYLANLKTIKRIYEENHDIRDRIQLLRYSQLEMIKNLIDHHRLSDIMRDIKFKNISEALKETTFEMKVEYKFLQEEIDSFRDTIGKLTSDYEHIKRDLAHHEAKDVASNKELSRLRGLVGNLESVDAWKQKIADKTAETDGYYKEYINVYYKLVK